MDSLGSAEDDRRAVAAMTVHLVGAGPGDGDLLTLRAARLLSEADVVVHDRLVGTDILELIPPWAIRIDVGKDPSGRHTPQDRINALLVALGLTHETVVRLKGGDPFVFGRGGEEILALRAAGVSTEIVPGITSSIAGPALAGVPVTHRAVAAGFTVVTAHRSADAPVESDADSALNWDALAATGTTLVFLMGAARARTISDRLIAAGLDAATPAAVVTRASRPDQTVARLPLADLGLEPVEAPSIIVVGATAGLDLTSLLTERAADGQAVAADPPHHLAPTGAHR